MSSLPQERLASSVRGVQSVFGGADPASVLPALSDEALLEAVATVAEGRQAIQLLGAVLSSEVARRSDRDLGYTGLAQRKGHRTGADLVQSITGQSRPDVRRATAVGEDLRRTTPGTDDPTAPHVDTPGDEPWYAPLTRALRAGALSREQYDAVRRGLGEPPADRYPDLPDGFLVRAWREAAATLAFDAVDRKTEELASDARLARDSLDPIGVQLRFDERFERRSLRLWTSADGQHHARIDFDDDAAVWVRTILNAALRPRRGPRFVDAATDPAESGADGDHARLAGDPAETRDDRTTEQLQYDTLVAVLRTGAAADPAQAFGDRQPGVRILVPADAAGTRDDSGRPVGIAYAEETAQALPLSMAERYICDAGTRPIALAPDGRPLDVGREQRLFTPRQRVALALRDGGCRWCGAEPSRCEAHHIDHWAEHRGRTDLADGVLLCRHCHMRLHNQGWRITRSGSAYRLHPPGGGPPTELRARSLLRFRRPRPLVDEEPP